LITQSGFAPLRIDMPNDLDRVSFKDAWENKKIVSFENVPINFIGYNDLLIVKLKTARPPDIADVISIKKEIRKTNECTIFTRKIR